MTPQETPYFLTLIKELRDQGYPPGGVRALLSELEKALGDTDTKPDPPITNDAVPNLNLLSEEGFFRDLVSDASVAVGVFWREKLLYANRKLKALFNYPETEVHQGVYPDFLCKYATPRTHAAMDERGRLLESGIVELEPIVGEFILEEGRKMFVEIQTKPFYTKQGIWRICFMIDVTEKLLARTELDHQMHRFESIISGTDAGTWEWNFRDETVMYNERWASMAGYSLKEVKQLGKDPWATLVHPDDVSIVDQAIENLLTGKVITLQFEARIRHRDGHLVWILCRGRITDWSEDGRPLNISGANIDITDRKVAEEKALKAKEELEKSVKALSIASKAKEDFLSTMSHEIRTPLNAVIGLSNLLLRRNPRPDQLELVKTLKNSSDNLLLLVNDILDYNKIQAGKLQLELVKFNVREFLEHVYSTFKHEASDKGIDLQIKADTQIPDVLEGDVTRLNQIFNNLLSNALKFTKKGTVSLEATLIDIEDSICTIRFVITDTGIGIHPSKLERIFEPFHQSDASITRQFGGSGLGLSIIKALVKMFNGSIEVNSIPGRGSSFSVLLKLKEPSIASSEPWGHSVELPFVAQRIRILYVEDVESNRFLVKNLMEEFNLSCTIASNGIEALEKTLLEPFDVILMDIQMPGMDGYQTAIEISKQHNGKNNMTSIVAFTAEPMTDSLREKLRKHNMHHVISKPFDINAFVDKISQLAVSNDSDINYSFSFYERPSTLENAGQLRKLVADEIEAFTVALLKAYNTSDLPLMRGEIHKLSPIIKNLKMVAVSMQLEQLRGYASIESSMLDVILSIKASVDRVVSDLRQPQSTLTAGN